MSIEAPHATIPGNGENRGSDGGGSETNENFLTFEFPPGAAQAITLNCSSLFKMGLFVSEYFVEPDGHDDDAPPLLHDGSLPSLPVV